MCGAHGDKMDLLERLNRAMLWYTAVILLDHIAEAWLTVMEMIAMVARGSLETLVDICKYQHA